MTEMNITDARANLAEVIAEAHSSQEPIHLTRRGQRVAAILDAKILEKLLESAEELADIRAAEETRQTIAEGEETIPWEEVKKELGLV